jgi:ABC-type methionine transport system permease subunit
MKKETVIAIMLGIVFGVIVAVVMVVKTKDQQIDKVKPMNTALHITPTISVNNTQFQPLQITSPETGVIVDKNAVTITAKASKDALIVIQSPIKTMIMKVTSETFSADFPLAFGENVITVSEYQKDTQAVAQEKELKIYYLDEQ